MILPTIMFYLFAVVAVASGVMVVSAKNPVHSVLFLILAFFNSAGLFVLLGAEFLAMILVIVYVGAVAVLFLFVVMMLDIDFAELRSGFMRYLPIGALIGFILLAELMLVFGSWAIAPGIAGLKAAALPANATALTNTRALGDLLYTRYIFAFQAAGLTTSDFKVDNAQGKASTMQTQAEADITEGASVLVIDALDSGSGAAIEANATSKGVKVIDYDRLVKGGTAGRVYVSFDNVSVGKLIGQGEVDCISAWNVSKPNVLVMDGDPTDNNATLFSQGYNGVLKSHFDDGSFVRWGSQRGPGRRPWRRRPSPSSSRRTRTSTR